MAKPFSAVFTQKMASGSRRVFEVAAGEVMQTHCYAGFDRLLWARRHYRSGVLGACAQKFYDIHIVNDSLIAAAALTRIGAHCSNCSSASIPL